MKFKKVRILWDLIVACCSRISAISLLLGWTTEDICQYAPNGQRQRYLARPLYTCYIYLMDILCHQLHEHDEQRQGYEHPVPNVTI
jgi:hypothetical protein